MIRTLCSIIVILLLAAQSLFADPAQRSLKIGFIGSFSGTAQIYGDAARNGFQLALQDLDNSTIEVLYEDDQFIPSKTVSAFNRLVNREKVDLVIAVGSTPCNAIAPLAQAKKIPLIAWASDRRVSKNRPYVFRSYPSGFAEGERAALEAKKRSYSRIALITSSSDYALSWKRGVASSLPSESIVLSEELSGNIQDFKPILLKAKARQAEELLICLNPGKSGLIAKQLRELGGKQRIGGCEYLHDRDEVIAAGGALNGAWFVTIPVQEEFRQRYLKKFGNDSVLSGAANHYDLATLLVAISQKNQKTDIPALLLEHGSFNGAVGPFQIRDNGEDRFFDISLVVREISNS